MDKKYLEIKKENFFTKFVNYIKKLFYREPKVLYTEISESENIKTDIEKSTFLDRLRIEREEEPTLLELQKRFENNPNDLKLFSDEELQSLIALYKRQRTDLKNKILNRKTELEELKFRIKSYTTNN